MAETVLAIFAHPDDETLACGGTLAKHVAAGDRVVAFVFSDGVTSRGDDEPMFPRYEAYCKACGILGICELGWGGLPDQRMDERAQLDVNQRIEQHIQIEAPTIVYTHHRGDLNRDHRIVAEAVLVATRPQPGMTVRRVYAGEVLSSTEWAFDGSFVPNVFVDITPHFDAKMAAMRCYADELRARPHARSDQGMEALASHRGLTVGVEFAEAFHLVREIR